jgi:4'-phosphopantetheinyl transferase
MQSPDPHQIHLWQFDLESEKSAINSLLASLSPQEKQQADNFHRPQDAQYFITRRGLARATLAHYLGIRPELVVFTFGHHGKPHLSPNHHHTSTRFNYSSAGRYLVLVIGRGHELGIDIENQRRPVEFSAIAGSYFSSEEQRILQQYHYTTNEFFTCWTAKEAIVKALGCGLSRQINDFTTLTSQGTLRKQLQLSNTDGTTASIYLQSLPQITGHIATLAVAFTGEYPEPHLVYKRTITSLD